MAESSRNLALSTPTDARNLGWLALWSTTYFPLSLLLFAAAFAGCLIGVFGLTTGRNLLARRPMA